MERVADINPAGDSVDDFGSVFAAIGDTVFFRANDGETGRELWATDGTEEGTRLVADVDPGAAAAGSFPHELTAVGDLLFFAARSAATGIELWRSDGTEAGTFLVKDIDPGGDSSSPRDLTVLGDVLLFSADDGSTGDELWRSDGTEAGTFLVKDIDPGGDSSLPGDLTAFGDVLLFRANDGTTGTELWRSDGTEAGTVLVEDIQPGALGSFPSGLTVFDSMVLFSANDGTTGTELWRSDGTGVGTELVANINPGGDGSGPVGFADLGDRLLFIAGDAVNGRELRRTDGTTAGTVLVADVNPGAGDARGAFSGPLDAAVVDGVAFLRLDDGTHGWELWRSDGTVAGTQLVADIEPGADPSFARDPVALGDGVLFRARGPGTGDEPWHSDGTAEGTLLARDINPGGTGSLLMSLGQSSAVDLPGLGETVLFYADDGTTGRELWRATLEDREVLRHGGASRFETAALLSAAQFSPGAPAAYVATGGNFPDALAGGVAAALEGAPLLLVGEDIPDATAAELERLDPGRIVVLGGTAAVSEALETALAGFTAGAVVRLSGPDRFATAGAVSQEAFPAGAGTAYVATGGNFPDALAGVAAAAAAPGPLLLVGDEIPDATAAELERLAPERIVILGGEAVVSAAVEGALAAYATTVDRLSGPSRFETAAAISSDAFPDGAADAFVATGFNFPDALAAGAVAGALGGPVLLTSVDQLSDATRDELDRLGPIRIHVMGGAAAVSDEVQAELEALLGVG